MGEHTKISWCDHTWNPWMGCIKVSRGCDHCYAETLITGRMGKPDLWGPAKRAMRQRTSPANWRKPLAWNRNAGDLRSRGVSGEAGVRLVFSGSLCDVFEDHPDANAARLDHWQLIRETPRLNWQLLTKRPENFMSMLPTDWGDGYPNVWLGVSVENMDVEWRVKILRETPARVRFLSYEPALGPLDDLDLDGIDWVIYGGESGPGFRPDDDQWARTMRSMCRGAGNAFFFKQTSAMRSGERPILDGRTYHEFPAAA